MELHDVSQDGREVLSPFYADVEAAENRMRAEAMLREQLSKRSGCYHFVLESLTVDTAGGRLPLLSASTINGMRRLVAGDLDALPVHTAAAMVSAGGRSSRTSQVATLPDGLPESSPELMRSKYCIRYELGLCPKYQGAKPPQELYLRNNGRRLALHFDCAACEMTVTSQLTPGRR